MKPSTTPTSPQTNSQSRFFSNQFWSDRQIKRDIIKLACLVFVIVMTFYIASLTSSISIPFSLALLTSLLVSPAIASLERKGFKRSTSVFILFTIMISFSIVTTYFSLRYAISEWHSLMENAPRYFEQVIARLRLAESSAHDKIPFLSDLNFTDDLLAWGKKNGQWFMLEGPKLVGNLMGNLLSCVFLFPIFTFVLLNDGLKIKRGFYSLVPNRFFEGFYHITHQIFDAFSDYLRAKLLEAFILGFLTWIGLLAIHSPYALVLATIAGITNIVPYLGPVLGSAPGIIIAMFDTSAAATASPGSSPLLIPMVSVYLITNIIDNVAIFPLIVAKLVNLHPIILILAVVIGQHYYGLIGMLISTPIASGLKIIFTEIYTSIYQQRDGNSLRTAKNELYFPNATEVVDEFKPHEPSPLTQYK